MSPTEKTVHAELLDCIQSNLAVFADHFHGPDSHLALGAAVRFRPVTGADGLPTVEPPFAEQIDAATEWLGLSQDLSWRDVSGQAIGELANRHGSLYVVADSFEMSWLPYFGHRHMDHSFLVEAVDDHATVIDAYLNHTPWGRAEPGRWESDWSALPPASLVLRLTPTAGTLKAEPHVDCQSPTDYVTAYATHPDKRLAFERLAAEAWLLARSRKLHAAFLAYRGEPGTAELRAHLDLWDELAGRAFLAMRRVGSGRPAPENLLTDLEAALTADPAVFGGTSQARVAADRRTVSAP